MYPSRMFKVLENKKHLRRKDTHTMAKDNVIEFNGGLIPILRMGASRHQNLLTKHFSTKPQLGVCCRHQLDLAAQNLKTNEDGAEV